MNFLYYRKYLSEYIVATSCLINLDPRLANGAELYNYAGSGSTRYACAQSVSNLLHSESRTSSSVVYTPYARTHHTLFKNERLLNSVSYAPVHTRLLNFDRIKKPKIGASRLREHANLRSTVVGCQFHNKKEQVAAIRSGLRYSKRQVPICVIDQKVGLRKAAGLQRFSDRRDIQPTYGKSAFFEPKGVRDTGQLTVGSMCEHSNLRLRPNALPYRGGFGLTNLVDDGDGKLRMPAKLSQGEREGAPRSLSTKKRHGGALSFFRNGVKIQPNHMSAMSACVNRRDCPTPERGLASKELTTRQGTLVFQQRHAPGPRAVTSSSSSKLGDGLFTKMEIEARGVVQGVPSVRQRCRPFGYSYTCSPGVRTSVGKVFGARLYSLNSHQVHANSGGACAKPVSTLEGGAQPTSEQRGTSERQACSHSSIGRRSYDGRGRPRGYFWDGLSISVKSRASFTYSDIVFPTRAAGTHSGSCRSSSSRSEIKSKRGSFGDRGSEVEWDQVKHTNQSLSGEAKQSTTCVNKQGNTQSTPVVTTAADPTRPSEVAHVPKVTVSTTREGVVGVAELAANYTEEDIKESPGSRDPRENNRGVTGDPGVTGQSRNSPENRRLDVATPPQDLLDYFITLYALFLKKVDRLQFAKPQLKVAAARTRPGGEARGIDNRLFNSRSLFFEAKPRREYVTPPQGSAKRSSRADAAANSARSVQMIDARSRPSWPVSVGGDMGTLHPHRGLPSKDVFQRARVIRSEAAATALLLPKKDQASATTLCLAATLLNNEQVQSAPLTFSGFTLTPFSSRPKYTPAGVSEAKQPPSFGKRGCFTPPTYHGVGTPHQRKAEVCSAKAEFTINRSRIFDPRSAASRSRIRVDNHRFPQDDNPSLCTPQVERQWCNPRTVCDIQVRECNRTFGSPVAIDPTGAVLHRAATDRPYFGRTYRKSTVNDTARRATRTVCAFFVQDCPVWVVRSQLGDAMSGLHDRKGQRSVVAADTRRLHPVGIRPGGATYATDSVYVMDDSRIGTLGHQPSRAGAVGRDKMRSSQVRLMKNESNRKSEGGCLNTVDAASWSPPKCAADVDHNRRLLKLKSLGLSNCVSTDNGYLFMWLQRSLRQDNFLRAKASSRFAAAPLGTLQALVKTGASVRDSGPQVAIVDHRTIHAIDLRSIYRQDSPLVHHTGVFIQRNCQRLRRRSMCNSGATTGSAGANYGCSSSYGSTSSNTPFARSATWVTSVQQLPSGQDVRLVSPVSEARALLASMVSPVSTASVLPVVSSSNRWVYTPVRSVRTKKRLCSQRVAKLSSVYSLASSAGVSSLNETVGSLSVNSRTQPRPVCGTVEGPHHPVRRMPDLYVRPTSSQVDSLRVLQKAAFWYAKHKVVKLSKGWQLSRLGFFEFSLHFGYTAPPALLQRIASPPARRAYGPERSRSEVRSSCNTCVTTRRRKAKLSLVRLRWRSIGTSRYQPAALRNKQQLVATRDGGSYGYTQSSYLNRQSRPYASGSCVPGRLITNQVLADRKTCRTERSSFCWSTSQTNPGLGSCRGAKVVRVRRIRSIHGSRVNLTIHHSLSGWLADLGVGSLDKPTEGKASTNLSAPTDHVSTLSRTAIKNSSMVGQSAQKTRTAYQSPLQASQVGPSQPKDNLALNLETLPKDVSDILRKRENTTRRVLGNPQGNPTGGGVSRLADPAACVRQRNSLSTGNSDKSGRVAELSSFVRYIKQPSHLWLRCNKLIQLKLNCSCPPLALLYAAAKR